MNRHFIVFDTQTGDIDVHSETPDGKRLSEPRFDKAPRPTTDGLNRLIDDIMKEE
jgi:hypothetical protein